MNSSRTLKLGVGTVLLLVVVAGAATVFVLGGDLSYESPTVESIESEFGAVNAESAVIETRVVVRNPNERGLPAPATIRYVVSLNNVTVARGEKSGVRVEPGVSVVHLDASFDNGKVPAWWASHVNNNETTVMRISPSVEVAGLVSQDLPARTSIIRTDLLGPLTSVNTREVVVANRSILVITDQRARWGEATTERTPLRVTMTLRNVHDRVVRLDGTAYEIRMNGVLVGEGRTTDGIRLEPGETGTFVVNAHIDTQRMQRWWVTHLTRNQTTLLNVTVEGVIIDDGERTRLPLSVFERRAVFETDFLGTGNTSVVVLDTSERGPKFAEPTVEETANRWGAVGANSTELVTDVTVSNPNDGALADVLELRVRQRTTINGVEVAESSRTIDRLPSGTENVTLVSAFDHGTVPVWWAEHINNGERSTVRTTVEGRADIGVTSFAIDVPDRANVVTTNTLAGLNNDTAQTITADGETLITIERSRASYGTATPERAPVVVRMTVTNEQSAPVTIRDINYTVALNNVTLAHRDSDETFELAPLETETFELTLVLNNSRMAQWWPTHIRNGERSTLHTSAYATIETPFESKRVRLDSISDDRTFETDLLGQDGE